MQLSPAAISVAWHALSFVHEYGTGILGMPEVSDTSREHPEYVVMLSHSTVRESLPVPALRPNTARIPGIEYPGNKHKNHSLP